MAACWCDAYHNSLLTLAGGAPDVQTNMLLCCRRATVE